MNRLIMGGALLILLGGIGFAIPVFTTQQTTDVASLGDLKLQTQEHVTYLISPLASAGVMALGLALVGYGLFRRP